MAYALRSVASYEEVESFRGCRNVAITPRPWTEDGVHDISLREEMITLLKEAGNGRKSMVNDGKPSASCRSKASMLDIVSSHDGADTILLMEKGKEGKFQRRSLRSRSFMPG